MYTSAILLSLLPAVLAQYGYGNSGSSSSSTASSSSPASTTTSSTSGITTIAVGNGGLNFSPNNISLPVGSVVEFQFYPPTHSVAQAAFADPCTPLANNTGFFSGGFTTSSGTNSNVFSIKINDTKPIWYYCGYPGHCEAGMVGVINPPADGSKTIDQFKAAAANVGSTVAPKTAQGGTVGPAADVKGGSSSSSSSGSSSSSASSTASSTSSSPSSSSTSKSNKGVEARGGVQWTLLGLTAVAAAGVGSLLA